MSPLGCVILLRMFEHDYVLRNASIKRNERRTLWVVLLSFGMMVIEIAAGYVTQSMSLLADGWHMASHVGALSISYLAYRIARSDRWHRHFSFGTGKFIPLGGYTSAVVLLGVAIIMGVESFFRLFDPHNIQFDEAIAVAFIGLIVNLICAWILGDGAGHHHHGHSHEHDPDHTHSHSHGHSDANLRGAYFHVLADALTSIFAIFALACGKWLSLPWCDALMGVVGSFIILRWAISLCRDTAWELLDGHPENFDPAKIRALFEDGSTVIHDIHVWTIAPKTYACELVVESPKAKGPEFYRAKLEQTFKFDHIVVEERLTSFRTSS